MTHRDTDEANRWKGFVVGMMGSLLGLLAMRAYWQRVAPIIPEEVREQVEPADEPQPLDEISPFGKVYEDGESSTAALGRIFYRQLAGREPQSEETKQLLSYLVHWGYGILQGGLYGAARSRASGLDLVGGALFATSLWFFGDEIAVPFLGLQKGPTAVPWPQHTDRLGAHLAYGLTTAVATQSLHRLL